MSRFPRIGGLIPVVVLAMLVPGCAVFSPGEHTFQVRGGQLHRGDDTFTLQAVWAPGLCASGGTLEAMVPAMARVAEAGGNTICFDLTGFNEDGSRLDPDSVATVHSFVERGKDQRMAVLVRVLGSAKDARFRARAVRTAAKAFEETRAVYWIDGPNAGELAKAFKRVNGNLVVAAPEHGDLAVVAAAPEEAPERPIVVHGAVPDFGLTNVHMLLDGDDADYTRLDAALTRPEETAPWSPGTALLCEEERVAGFVSLFDGKTLDGWWMKGDNKESFHVSEDGFIEWLSGGGGALMSRSRYANFVLRLDYKILPDGNSGVWIRAPRGARESKIGFEVQMRGDSADEEPTPDSSGAIYDVLAPTEIAVRKEGLWNELEVVCDGPLVRVTLNGMTIQDVNFDEVEELKYRLRKGFICLTDHGNYVAFRNIRIKELP